MDQIRLYPLQSLTEGIQFHSVAGFTPGMRSRKALRPIDNLVHSQYQLHLVPQLDESLLIYCRDPATANHRNTQLFHTHSPFALTAIDLFRTINPIPHFCASAYHIIPHRSQNATVLLRQGLLLHLDQNLHGRFPIGIDILICLQIIPERKLLRDQRSQFDLLLVCKTDRLGVILGAVHHAGV